MKSVLLIGSGGVGTIAALALESSKKTEVTLVVRGDYDTVVDKGYEIDSVDYGKKSGWKPSRVVKSIDEAAKYAPYDYIVVCTKCIPELQKTEDLIRPAVRDGTVIVLVQNGLGNEPPVMEAFPSSYVLGGVSLIGSTNYGAKIKHVSPDILYVGTFDKRSEATAITKEFVDIYNTAEGKCEFEPDLGLRRWSKLMYNATYNTVAALTGLDTGRIFFSGVQSSIIAPAMAELRLLAETALGEKLPSGLEEFLLNCDTNEYYAPSMLVDVRKGQLMELEVILGNPLRSGAKNGVDTPLLRAVYCMLRGKQMQLLEARGEIKLPPLGFDVDTAKPVFTTLPWTE